MIIYLFIENPQPRDRITIEQLNLNTILPVVTHRLTFVVLMGIALYGAGYGLAITMIPAFLISAKGFSQAAISLTFSLFYIAISLSQLIAGPFSDKKGRRGVMAWGLILAAAGRA